MYRLIIHKTRKWRISLGRKRNHSSSLLTRGYFYCWCSKCWCWYSVIDAFLFSAKRSEKSRFPNGQLMVSWVTSSSKRSIHHLLEPAWRLGKTILRTSAIRYLFLFSLVSVFHACRNIYLQLNTSSLWQILVLSNEKFERGSFVKWLLAYCFSRMVYWLLRNRNKYHKSLSAI